LGIFPNNRRVLNYLAGWRRLNFLLLLGGDLLYSFALHALLFPDGQVRVDQVSDLILHGLIVLVVYFPLLTTRLTHTLVRGRLKVAVTLSFVELSRFLVLVFVITIHSSTQIIEVNVEIGCCATLHPL